MFVINAILSLALAITSAAQDSQSYQWNKKSTFTAQHQVEFPGIVVEPGVYIVRLKETGNTRSQVQLLNQDETQVLATFFAIPDHRIRPDDNSEFVFHEIKNDEPVPVRSWFFSGDLVGLEFVYPKERAKVIAKHSDDHVAASNDSRDGAIVAITPNGKEIVIDEAPAAQTARRKPQP
jgi:hypothetical protein